MRIALFLAALVGFPLYVIALAGQLLAQPLGCLQIDRYGELCIPSTGDIFVQDAHQKLASDGWVDRSTNKKGERCCDSGKDCFSLEPERIEQAQGGVNITLDDGRRIFVPGNEIMPSEDGKWWLCYWGNKVRCVFAPYSGS